MATNFWYPYGLAEMQKGIIGIGQAGNTIGVALVMNNSTADSEPLATFVGEITALDEFDGAGYSRETLAGSTVTVNSANFRTVWDGTDVQFGQLSAGTSTIKGALHFIRSGASDGVRRPLWYTSYGGFDFNPAGGSITLGYTSAGIAGMKYKDT